MNRLKLKIIGILLAAFLFLLNNNGEALVTPQDYERMKMKNRGNAEEPEKAQNQAPILIQVHQPNPGQPQTGKPVRNNPPGDKK